MNAFQRAYVQGTLKVSTNATLYTEPVHSILRKTDVWQGLAEIQIWLAPSARLRFPTPMLVSAERW